VRAGEERAAGGFCFKPLLKQSKLFLRIFLPSGRNYLPVVWNSICGRIELFFARRRQFFSTGLLKSLWKRRLESNIRVPI
jgi:hypothetical protein